MNASSPFPRNGPHAAGRTPFPSTESAAIPRREVASDDIAECLRVIMGLAPDQPVPEERAASAGKPLPLIVAGLDASAWIAWCLAGLPLFVDGFPPLRDVKAAAGRVLVALAMLRSEGNLTQASLLVGASRKVFRDNLRSGGLYPWRRRLDGSIYGGRWGRGA